MKQKLNPCPFCGGKPGWYKNSADDIVGVMCRNKNCGAAVVFFQRSWNTAYNNKAEIAELYNGRV